MTIKITKVMSAKEPFQPIGKTYTVFSWIVHGQINGIIDPRNLELKAFKHQIIEEGAECEVEMQDYQGTITYKILKVKKPQTTTAQAATPQVAKNHYSKGQYSLSEYDDLFTYAWNIFEPKLSKISDPYQKYECLQKLVSTFIIGAVQIGIKAPVGSEAFTNQHQYSQRQKLLVG